MRDDLNLDATLILLTRKHDNLIINQQVNVKLSLYLPRLIFILNAIKNPLTIRTYLTHEV